MGHLLSSEDREFQKQFETCRFPPSEFTHHQHLRLAYVYLVENDSDASYRMTRDSIHRFLEYHGVELSKYHDTITRAWVMAVRHFMEQTPHCNSGEDFIGQNPVMLDPEIMLTHYSAKLLFSDEARAKFVEPDLDPIPQYPE